MLKNAARNSTAPRNYNDNNDSVYEQGGSNKTNC